MDNQASYFIHSNPVSFRQECEKRSEGRCRLKVPGFIGVEVFSNPLAPPSLSSHHGGHQGSSLPALTNEDFRKLLMTPRSGAPSVAPPSAKSSSHTLKSVPVNIQSHRSSRAEEDDDDDVDGDGNDPWSRRRKKKKYYAKLKKIEEEREQELASKYRDRARERRDGLNPDYQNTAAERRRQAIQESKFLGGDMEHTHLVRSEIAEDEEEDEELNVKKVKTKQKDKEEDDEGDEVEFTTKLGQKVYKALFRSRPADRNELFQPGRMVKKRREMISMLVKNIFGDVGDYDPTETTKEYGKKSRTKEKEREKERKKSRSSSSYFNKSADGEDDVSIKLHQDTPIQFDKKVVSAEEFAKSVAQTFGKKHEMEERAAWDSVEPKHRKRDRSSRKVKDVDYVPDSYSECYPGAVDVPYDSDEEADYSKMDLGNKKGPIKRWDFETEEDYHSYMESREALPKAAFQFGIKMSEGRKTRRAGPKDEKAKLDRDWQKISKVCNIILV
ncbi:Protein Red [Acropora cervicornis]|uniref:Protein Red n=1 Tax=Acropora cervicornis TaxID=6130 RepID=A0AAD9UVK8_ACRCE|nr:Protein Red [Acropora cervicornis]